MRHFPSNFTEHFAYLVNHQWRWFRNAAGCNRAMIFKINRTIAGDQRDTELHRTIYRTHTKQTVWWPERKQNLSFTHTFELLLIQRRLLVCPFGHVKLFARRGRHTQRPVAASKKQAVVRASVRVAVCQTLLHSGSPTFRFLCVLHA